MRDVQEKDLKIGLLCDFYGRMLTDKQREATAMYYDDDLSLAEIAEHVGITRQGVWDSIKRAPRAFLRSWRKSLDLPPGLRAYEQGGAD